MEMRLLDSEERAKLRQAHRKAKSRIEADRIKAVLFADRGWTYVKIAEALLVDEETASRYVEDYLNEERLTHKSGGSSSKLDMQQSQQLKAHIADNTYTKAEDICAYVYRAYGLVYSVSGMTNWLHENGFTFKSPKKAPQKANKAEQEAFIREYLKLLGECSEEDIVLFGDGVHPTQATKIAHGWILKGQDKIIASSASRTRLNIMGAIDLERMDVTATFHDTINSSAMCEHLQVLKDKYLHCKKIHLILDRGAYNRSAETMEAAANLGITIHHLPAYSPNLNPIERLWKFMNEKVRNNRHFTTAKEFRESIHYFFTDIVKNCKSEMKSRINDNFQISGVFA